MRAVRSAIDVPNISPGRVATCSSCGAMFGDEFIRNLLLSRMVNKSFKRSVFSELVSKSMLQPPLSHSCSVRFFSGPL